MARLRRSDRVCTVRFYACSQVTEFEVQGFSKECWEQMGGNLKEYSHCLLQLYTLRRSRYYICA